MPMVQVIFRCILVGLQKGLTTFKLLNNKHSFKTNVNNITQIFACGTEQFKFLFLFLPQGPVAWKGLS